MKKLIIHLISDFSGQTVTHAANTALARFSDISVKKYHWPMIRNLDLLNEVLVKIKIKPGIILYTISNKKLSDTLKDFCSKIQLPCISIVSRVVQEIANYIDESTNNKINYISKFDKTYFDKVSAIDYSLRHDDGQMLDDLEEADIILIGPSRSSKTPTSVYLSCNGFKTANIPFIHGLALPDVLFEIHNAIVFGLTINPHRLAKIREKRMDSFKLNGGSSYTDIETIQDECREVRKICFNNNWETIDVSIRSIEETAAILMKTYYNKKGRV